MSTPQTERAANASSVSADRRTCLKRRVPTKRGRTSPRCNGSELPATKPFAAIVRFALLALTTLLAATRPLSAAPVEVRFTEGVGRGFLMLRTLDGNAIASGELLQAVENGHVKSRMVFDFDDGSLLDETVVYTQERVFEMKSYTLEQRGPAFSEDTVISMDRVSGTYAVSVTSHENGREQRFEGNIELPPDAYNGMVLTVAKNLPKETGRTVQLVAFTPEPVLLELEISLGDDHDVLVGDLVKTATHFVLRPHAGPLIDFFARLFRRLPADYHAWILTDEAPAFVRFEGALDPTGPVWRIEVISPHWPE